MCFQGAGETSGKLALGTAIRGCCRVDLQLPAVVLAKRAANAPAGARRCQAAGQLATLGCRSRRDAIAVPKLPLPLEIVPIVGIPAARHEALRHRWGHVSLRAIQLGAAPLARPAFLAAMGLVNRQRAWLWLACPGRAWLRKEVARRNVQDAAATGTRHGQPCVGRAQEHESAAVRAGVLGERDRQARQVGRRRSLELRSIRGKR